MLVVTRYRVDPGTGLGADEFLARAETALAALAQRPGFRAGRVGRAVDDPAMWVLSTEWEHVGAYRRALSAYEVKVNAVPLLSLAVDEPSAYEVLVSTGSGEPPPGAGRGTDRAADADRVGLGTASAANVPTDLGAAALDAVPTGAVAAPVGRAQFSDPSIGYDDLYVAVGEDLDLVPWAQLRPWPALVAWLDAQPAPVPGRRALVVACGFGDDAEELAARGYDVTAFDLAPTAIDWCRRRFPDSAVDYRVADLLALPEAWRRAFDLVVEIHTIQSLPPELQRAGIAAVAATLAPGGQLFLRCAIRPVGPPEHRRPWPLTKAELRALVAEGLEEISLEPEIGSEPMWLGLYERPAATSAAS